MDNITDCSVRRHGGPLSNTVQPSLTRSVAGSDRSPVTAHRPVTDRWTPSIAGTPVTRRPTPRPLVIKSCASFHEGHRRGARRALQGGGLVAVTPGHTGDAVVTGGSFPTRVVPPVELPASTSFLAGEAATRLDWTAVVLPEVTMLGRKVCVVARLRTDVHAERIAVGIGPVTDR